MAVTAVSQLEDSLFPDETGIGSDRIVGEMGRMLVGADALQADGQQRPGTQWL